MDHSSKKPSEQSSCVVLRIRRANTLQRLQKGDDLSRHAVSRLRRDSMTCPRPRKARDATAPLEQDSSQGPKIMGCP
ncbi:hypothetical protein Y032_0175g524 [Ancylostoma ceylanicum]|uniref:Uncharacterized protein n=1 Tax=Ancylostoma ceylanicum TaxID=53326 RepID=A0A016SUV4_9BILA|nr:hypothetical protein Y032_0175g524 [Ancylostoma ceylanicum]